MKALFITSAVLNIFFFIYCVLHYWRARLFHCGWKEYRKDRIYFLATPSVQALFSINNIFFIKHRYQPTDIALRFSLLQAIRRQRLIEALKALHIEQDAQIIAFLQNKPKTNKTQVEMSAEGFEEEEVEV